MTEEFYHKNIFGEVVDLDLQEIEEDEKLPLDKRGKQFNIFALTDAFGSRKKKDVWVLFRRAILAGVSAEEIFFKLFWQLKSMLLALRTKTAFEALMSTFPYNKSKSFLKNFKTSELINLQTFLVVGYHKARRGEGEIETLVEKVLLSL